MSADDITFACFRKIIQELIGSLEFESHVPLNWFNKNNMIVNRGKFQAIMIETRK